MGDRCHMAITCRECDADRFVDLGFVNQIDAPADLPGCVVLEDFEANYAHEGDLPEDIPYFGGHGPGDGYNSHVVACDGLGGGPKWALSTDDTIHPAVLLDRDTGSIDSSTLRAAREFIAAYKMARSIMGAGVSPPGGVWRYRMDVCDSDGNDVAAFIYLRDREAGEGMPGGAFEIVSIQSQSSGREVEVLGHEMQAIIDYVGTERHVGRMGERVNAPQEPAKNCE